MVTVLPFKGVRFKTKDLKEIITEPYDKIPKDLQKKYYEKSDYNFIRLNLPVDADPYTSARKTLSDWLNSDILIEEESPSFYEYIEDFSLFGENRRRRGLFAVVKLENYDENHIHRHERTFSGPKADRLEMMRSTKTDLEPVLFIFDDPDKEVTRAIDLAEKENCFDFTDENGLRHVVNKFESPKITELFKEKELVIADGHHRYESSLTYAKEMNFSGNSGYVLVVLVEKSDPGLPVLASHRVVMASSLSAKELLEEIKEFFVVEERNKAEVSDPLKDELLFYYKDHCFSLTPKDTIVSSLTTVEKLNVSLLNKYIIPKIQDGTEEKAVEFSRWVTDAMKKVDDGIAKYAFLIRPTDASTVWDVAIHGGVMPQKSTDFYPKLVSGLILFKLT